MKDKANFYKLSEEEQKNITDLWEDASPDVKTFADNLTEEIKSSDTPFVLEIDGGYGTGKTYFSTRFSEHLKRNDIETIYCSVWENDYLENPFIAISKEIVKYIKNDKFKNIRKKLINTFKNCFLDAQIFGISGKTLIKSWMNNKDKIVEFKKEFANFIDNLKDKKLVLIIDELDRCKPDFAVKTLEILKHFFDIEGLFVVLMINKSRLEKHIDAYYNIQDDKNGEEYLQKFINRYEYIPNMNYKVVINDFLTVDSLKPAIDKNNITQNDGVFYSFKELKTYLVTACSDAKLTYRESQELCRKCIEFCNNYNEPIRCRFLPYTLLGYYKFKDMEKYKNFRDFFIGKRNWVIQEINKFINTTNDTKWENIKKSFKELKYECDRQNTWGVSYIKLALSYNDYQRIKTIYEELLFCGADDNDENRTQKYETIGKNFNKLYDSNF